MNLKLPMDLNLERWPLPGADNLQAWDAADEYLLRKLDDGGQPVAGARILLVNDAFGALGVSLAAWRPVSWNDSLLSRLALERNLERNGLPRDAVTFAPADLPPPGEFDLVILRFPKNLAWLEDSLRRLRPHIEQGVRVLAGGMIKHTPERAYNRLEACIGPVKTSLGWKKARLALAVTDGSRVVPDHLPDCEVTVPDFDLVLRNRANVFSREALDLGARMLLGRLPVLDGSARVADLGCGNGVLALALARRCPEARILGTDASWQAVACARDNARANGLPVEFAVMDCLGEVPDDSLDLVLCNPPFHQGLVVGDHLARLMIADAHRALKPGGELRLVGNRHLGYHARLKEVFGNACQVARTLKFVVLKALKQVEGGSEISG